MTANVPKSAGASGAAGAQIQGQVTEKGASFSGTDQEVLAQSVKGDGAYGAIKPLPALAGRRGYYGAIIPLQAGAAGAPYGHLDAQRGRCVLAGCDAEAKVQPPLTRGGLALACCQSHYTGALAAGFRPYPELTMSLGSHRILSAGLLGLMGDIRASDIPLDTQLAITVADAQACLRAAMRAPPAEVDQVFDTATAPEPAPRTARPRPATAKRHITTTVRHLGAILLVASETGRPLGLDLFRPNTPRASTKKAHRPTLAKG
jgi:hypothetical protein